MTDTPKDDLVKLLQGSLEGMTDAQKQDLMWKAADELSRRDEATVVVPREPTVEMMLAALSEHRKWEDENNPTSGYWPRIWLAMLAAAKGEGN